MNIFCHLKTETGDIVVPFFEELPEHVVIEEFVEELRQLCKRHRDDKDAPNAQKVVIKGVNVEVFNKYLEGVADQPPANGRYAQTVEEYQIFSSGMALSKHLGYDYNEVSQALRRVRSKPQSERIAVVRGVSFMSLQDWVAQSRD